MNNKFFDFLFPITGGISGSILGFVTLEQIASVIIFSFIGATIGYFVKYFYDKLLKRKKNNKK